MKTASTEPIEKSQALPLMQVDNTPAIKAYCEQRIEQLEKDGWKQGYPTASRIEELRSVIVLCDGITQVTETLMSAVNAALKPKDGGQQ